MKFSIVKYNNEKLVEVDLEVTWIKPRFNINELNDMRDLLLKELV